MYAKCFKRLLDLVLSVMALLALSPILLLLTVIGAIVMKGNPFFTQPRPGLKGADGKEQIFRDVEKPLKCIMEVRRSPLNYVRKLNEDQARQLIMQQSFVPMWDTDAAVMAMANVRQLVRKVPIYRVFCGPTVEDAKAIYDILVNHPEQIREEAKDMKIKEGFVLRNVVDEFIVMPTGDNIAKFEGAVVLNEVSAIIFKQLENPVSREDLLAAMLGEYDVDEATAAADLDALLEKLADMGVLEK